MGCGRSRAKVYLADNRDVVDKHTPLFAELGIRNDTVAAAVLAKWAKLLEVHTKQRRKGTAAPTPHPPGTQTIDFHTFARGLGLQSSKFALNCFALGADCEVSAFPRVKEQARMGAEGFCRVVVNVGVRTPDGLKTLAYSLYKDRPDGISANAMVKLVHETYDLLFMAHETAIGESPMGQGGLGSAEKDRVVAKADAQIYEAAGRDGVFQWGEFDSLMRKRHQMLQQVFLLQDALRSNVKWVPWGRLTKQIGDRHSKTFESDTGEKPWYLR